MNESTQKWSIRIIMWPLIVAFIFVFSNVEIVSRLIMAFSMFIGVLFVLYVLLEIEKWKKMEKNGRKNG